jgi:Domain of unknown function (DUF4252)
MNVVKQLLTLAVAALPLGALAQDGRLNLPDFSALAARATDHTDISLNGDQLGFASHIGDDKNRDVAHAHKLIAGLKNLEIHTYEFNADGAYSASDVEMVRRQLQSPEWKRLMQTHSAQEREDVDIYVSMDGQRTNGLALIVAEPRALTIINLVGSIDLKDLAKLGGQMGIPKQVASIADSGTKTAAD